MRNKFLPLIFIVFTFFIGSTILVFNGGNEFSITENRELSQIRQFTISEWIEGSFQKNVENTLADHFVAREYFVKIHNNINLSLDKLMKFVIENAFALSFDDKVEVSTINENISLLTINGRERLIRNPKEYNQETKRFIEKKIQLLNNYSMKYPRVNFYSYFVISPHHSELVYPKYNASLLIPIIKTLEFPVGFFEITKLDMIENYFYKTDHHWNHRGSYKGYQEIVELMLIEEEEVLIPENLVCFEEIEFWGSHSRRIAHSVEIESDEMCKYIFDLPEYTLYIDGKKQDNYGNFDDYISGVILEKDEKGFDHYNHLNQSRKAEIIIDTNRKKLENLLVISDSLSNPIREPISAYFNKTIFINLNSYNGKLGTFDMNEYIKERDIDNVLIFLSMDNLFPNGEIKHLNE